jgi:polysaccharide biosynthesis protein PslH
MTRPGGGGAKSTSEGHSVRQEVPVQRALLISTENPFPADSGGRLRLRGILDVLTQRFAIDLVTYERPASPELAEARSRLNLVQVPRTVTPRSAAFRSLYRRRNCGYMGHADLDMMTTARALCVSESYRAVFIDNTVLGYFIPRLRALQPQARFVTIAHNFETSLCTQLAESQRSMLRRAIFSLSARHTRREETRVCRQTDLLLATSAEEAASFATLVPAVAGKTVVVPSCIDVASYARLRQRRPEGESIVFSGDMAYFPNVAAARYFHSHIYPALKARRPGITLQLVGRNPHPSLLEIERQDPSVTVTGYVSDAAAHIVKSPVVIVPLLHGSGTRLKILEAWAVDRPVVSTSKGCEGLDCRDGHDLIIADAPDAFVDGICRLLDDPEFAARLARQARQTLLDRYDIRSIADRILATVEDLPMAPDEESVARSLAS